jgi:hypothetical protein
MRISLAMFAGINSEQLNGSPWDLLLGTSWKFVDISQCWLRSDHSQENLTWDLTCVSGAARWIRMKVAEKKRRNYLLREVARELHEDDPYLKISHSSTVHAYNFIYILKKNRTLPAPIFTKIATAYQRYVQISYTEFHPSKFLKTV